MIGDARQNRVEQRALGAVRQPALVQEKDRVGKSAARHERRNVVTANSDVPVARVDDAGSPRIHGQLQ